MDSLTIREISTHRESFIYLSHTYCIHCSVAGPCFHKAYDIGICESLFIFISSAASRRVQSMWLVSKHFYYQSSNGRSAMVKLSETTVSYPIHKCILTEYDLI